MMKDTDSGLDRVILNSPVVISNSVETQEIDPFLLAVPLPIVAIGTGSAAPKKPVGIVTAKTVSSPPWKPTPLGLSFEHTFPSVFEMQNPTTLKKATKHVLQVLQGTARSNPASMRDIHLLYHFSKMQLLDKVTMKALCEALAVPSTRTLPQRVRVAMEMAKLSLGSSESDE